MRPLNGKCAMTREEKNARRRELDKDPFHHALTLREQRKRRAKVKDKANARRREWYKEHREQELERSRKWHRENREKAREACRRWHREHKAQRAAYERKRNEDPEFVLHKKAVRKARESTPKGRAKINATRRTYWQKIKFTEAAIAWKVKYLLEPRWRKLITETDEAVERYERRCTVQTWSLFVKWARERGRYFDPQKRSSKGRGKSCGGKEAA